MEGICFAILVGFLFVGFVLSVWGFVLGKRLDEIANEIRKLADSPEGGATPAGKGEP